MDKDKELVICDYSLMNACDGYGCKHAVLHDYSEECDALCPEKPCSRCIVEGKELTIEDGITANNFHLYTPEGGK